jgi:hypothetical protein
MNRNQWGIFTPVLIAVALCLALTLGAGIALIVITWNLAVPQRTPMATMQVGVTASGACFTINNDKSVTIDFDVCNRLGMIGSINIKDGVIRGETFQTQTSTQIQ